MSTRLARPSITSIARLINSASCQQTHRHQHVDIHHLSTHRQRDTHMRTNIQYTQHLLIIIIIIIMQRLTRHVSVIRMMNRRLKTISTEPVDKALINSTYWTTELQYFNSLHLSILQKKLCCVKNITLLFLEQLSQK